MRKATQRSVSNPPQIWKTRGPFTGSVNRLDALSPKKVQTIIAKIQIVIVMLAIKRIAFTLPTTGVITCLMIMMMKAHSFPLANYIATPVLNPILWWFSEMPRILGFMRNIVNAIAAKNVIPIQ